MGQPETCADLVVVVLSDTHGHLYPQVKRLLQGVDHIIHAGDVGSPQVLTELKSIAPVTAVRGNCDLEAWAQSLPLHARLELGGVRILVGHIGARLRAAAEREGHGGVGDSLGQDEDARDYEVVITGHSHVAAMEERGGTLYLNPGSAGPRRFERPRTLARLVIRRAPGGGPGSPSPSRARISGKIVTIEDAHR